MARPNDEEAISAMALTDFQMGKTDAAALRLEKSLRKFPTRLRLSVALAQIKLMKEDLAGAEQTLKKATSVAPNSPVARFALGQVYLLRGHPEEAEPEIVKALEIDPNDEQALLSLAALQIGAQRLSEAESTLKRLSALPSTKYKDLHAAFVYEMGRKNTAIFELQILLRDDPGNRVVRSRLLLIYLSTNRGDDAEKLLADALKRNPHDADALYERSLLDLKLGRPRQVEQDLSHILELQPDSARAHFALAHVYALEGFRARQRQELTEAIRLDRDLLGARLELAKSFVFANQPQAALNLLQEAPESQKNTAAVILARNWALLQARNTKELRSSLEQALRVTRTPELVLQAC